MVVSDIFENTINGIRVPVLAKGQECSGVVFTNKNDVSDPSILFALETARSRFNADAVYFRYYADRKTYIPQMYIFDFTIKAYSEDHRKNVHKAMWNGSQVPAYMIVEKAQITICNARLTPDNSNESISEILKCAADSFDKFPSSEFANGMFWELLDKEQNNNFDQTATKDLIRGLKSVFTDFRSQSGLDRHVALRLLMQCLLIKYIEERDDSNKSGYFASHYFKVNFNCDDFCSTIRAGKLLDLLDLLSKDFNGKIFEWDVETQVEDRAAIQQTEVKKLADYLDANIEDNQYLLWRKYSFSCLPVEIISSVYEELLTDSKDIVYTPEMIVSTLIDECMPIDKPQKNFKLIDVSCGSGIFLVKAYKRLIQWWRYEQWKQTGELKKPNLETLKTILTNSVYGVDVERDAINLSVFSLALAILDEVDLNPPLWNELKFPRIDRNISCQNFFEYITDSRNYGVFDLVIGNPPFNLKKENSKEPSRKDYFNEVKKLYGYQSNIIIPDENPALHFLSNSMPLLKDRGSLCMIQPSNPLLYQKDEKFKESLFGKHNLLQVIDFTNLDDKLWGRKRVATAAVFLENSKPDTKNVLHLVANRSFSNTHKLFLEFDYYDFHYVSKHDAIYNPYIWKSNLLGGYRVNRMIDKFTKCRTIGEFLRQKESEGWASGEGFIEGNKIELDYIYGQAFLDTESFKGDYSHNKLGVCTINRFWRRTSKILFEPPHLLIRKVLKKDGLISCLYNEYVTFKCGIYSIHAPQEDIGILKHLADYLEKNGVLLRFLVQAMSSRVGVIKVNSFYDEDIENLPYPEEDFYVKLTEADKIIMNDALEYYSNPRKQSIHKKLYQENVSPKELILFADVFCKGLNSYAKCEDNEYSLSKVIDAGDYYAVQFEFRKIGEIHYLEEKNDDIAGYLRSLFPSRDKHINSAYIQKILKIGGSGIVILVKPKNRRYWLQSMALRDSDDIFADNIQMLTHV